MTTDPSPVILSSALELQPAGDTSVQVFPDDLRICMGERWALMGPSGCGKTSLVNSLCGLLAPANGSLRILDQDLYAMPSGKRDRFRGRRLGVVHQEFHLLSAFTAEENLRVALRFSAGLQGRIARQQTAAMLETAGLSHRAHTPVKRLSRGEAQRVAVARALVHRPEILITDEPTASLDADRAAEMLDWMNQLRLQSDCAWICVTHDPAVATRFDHQLHARNWTQKER